MESAVAPAEVKQRVEPGFERRLLHLADQDEMVATVMDCMMLAFEHGKRVEQDRDTMPAHVPRGAAEAVLAPGRKGDRARLLLGLKHIDREMLGVRQRPGAGRPLGD